MSMNIADIAAIVNAGGGGGGYKKETTYSTIFDGTLEFGSASWTSSSIDPAEIESSYTKTIRITFDGQTYVATAVPDGSVLRYGAPWNGDEYDFSEYPIAIYALSDGATDLIIDRPEGDYALKLEGIDEEIIVTDDFRDAVNSITGYDFVILEDGDTSSGDWSLASGDRQKVIDKLTAGKMIRGVVWSHSVIRKEDSYNYLYAIKYDDYLDKIVLDFDDNLGYRLYWLADGTISQ